MQPIANIYFEYASKMRYSSAISDYINAIDYIFTTFKTVSEIKGIIQHLDVFTHEHTQGHNHL